MDSQLELKLYGEEIDLTNHVDARGVRYLGKATKQNNGKYAVLADFYGSLCLVEVIIKEKTNG